ncbi:hypothetical protein FOA52_003625 [Chlamydomonas sp. UWO 241]|nr:hypothetical protein FOA52_003625 [Chlamydomonas sp. UWO 241]
MCGVFAHGSRITGAPQFFELSALKTAGAGWLVNDTLVLTVDVNVQREDIFQLDTGGVPCDVTLKLHCGAEIPVLSHLLRLGSPFFRGVLEDVNGGAAIPVDGNLDTWTYILKDLYPQYDPPALTLSSVYKLLPVVHKYDFTKLLERMVAFVKGMSGALSHDPAHPTIYIIRWLALAEVLQLDALRELCLGKLRGMTREQRKAALVVEVKAGTAPVELKTHRLRREVMQLGHDLLAELFVLIVASY